MRLPCLLACPFHAGLAVRRGFGAESTPATATHVVEKITSLLQAQMADSASKNKVRRTVQAVHLSTQRASQQITPNMRPALNKALETVVKEIESIVDLKIRQDHAKTQDGINERVQSIGDRTQVAKRHHQTAKQKDEAWFKCVAQEKNMLASVEKAEQDLKESRSNTEEPCQREQDLSSFSYDANVEKFVFTCNMAEDSRCTQAFRDFDQGVEEVLNDLSSKESKHSSDHQSAKQQCKEARDDVIRKQSALDDRRGEWQAQGEECDDKQEERNTAMCLFGLKAQLKCESVGTYEDFMGDVDKENGGVYSHPDRVQQWRAAHVTKCMLGKVISDFEINSATMSACDSEVDFDTQVGQLDRKAGAVSELTSPENFTCKEQTIKFYGQTWHFPNGDGTSDDYVRKAWEPEINFDKDSLPFDFCGSQGKQTCADYRCQKGKVQDGDRVCQGECSDAQCC